MRPRYLVVIAATAALTTATACSSSSKTASPASTSAASSSPAGVTAASSAAFAPSSSAPSSSAPAPASSAATGPAVHVTFQNIPPDTGAEATVLKQLMTQFAQTHPGSTLTLNDVPQNQTDQKLQLEGAQNALPDMFFGPGTPAAQKQMCDQGLSLNVGDAVAKLGATAAFNPAAVQVIENQQGGKLCAIPFELNMEGFWYNTKIFSANGLTPPATWDALVSDAAALSAKGIQPLAASGLQGWPLTRLVSGYIFRDQGPGAMQKIADGTAKLTDPEYVKAAAAVAALGSKNYFGKGVASLDYSPAEAEFLTGKAAMFYMGSWALSDFNTASLNQIGDDNIGFFPFPAVAGGSGSVDQTPENAGQPVMISAKSYNANPAMADWLKFVVENYGAAAIALGDLSGFAIAQTPASLPATTKLAIAELAATKTPVGWFETLFNAKATNVSQTNAARLVTGSLSAQSFMATVQAAVPGS